MWSISDKISLPDGIGSFDPKGSGTFCIVFGKICQIARYGSGPTDQIRTGSSLRSFGLDWMDYHPNYPAFTKLGIEFASYAVSLQQKFNTSV
jgi:hypothetical protein